MSSRRVPIALGSGGTHTEESRAFFQSRLTLFGGWVFLTSGAFNLVIAALNSASGVPFTAGNAFHLAGTFVAGAVWALASYRPLSIATERLLDAAGTVLMCASFSLMAATFASIRTARMTDPMHELFIGLLACSHVLFARAIALPSTPARTAAISAAAMVPMLAASFFVLRRPETTSQIQGGSIDIVMWSIAAVSMASVTSRVIFGLRAEVSKIRQLGQYTLDEKIGEGGMGVVYRAHHALLRRPTAIKLLAPETAGADTIRRFEREVQLTARLSHPNTVAVFDYGHTPEGVFYYAMEFLDGINLEDLVRKEGAQSPGRVVHILQQVSGALAEAHSIGLIHRDIKPANIILCERGGQPDVAKVVDFGLVKQFQMPDDDPTVAVTAAHMLMGTPLYMAPEAIAGDDTLDGRSDLYALGAVGYFLLTGTAVFSARTVIEVCSHHLHTSPEPPSARSPQSIPPLLESVILQCLAKAPDSRPPDAKALQQALRACAAVAPWSEEEAAHWWAAFRVAEVRSPKPVVQREGLTAVIDLAHRGNPWR